MGWLAILMIALAPTVSRIHSMQEGDAPGEMPCDMSSMHGEAPASPDHAHTFAPDTDACAYCSLLMHMPAVLSVPLAFALFVQTAFQHIVARFKSALLLEPVRPGRPRAPPRLPS